ncbi:MAG: nucleotidyltransferase domain-containing protein [Nitrososphaeria archaeon]
MRNLDLAWERARILRNWKNWLSGVKKAANEVLNSNLVGLYVFGSAVTGDLVAFSDIDLLIITRNLPKSAVARSQIKEDIVNRAGLPLVHPFEIHLVDGEEAGVYFKHIGRDFIKL